MNDNAEERAPCRSIYALERNKRDRMSRASGKSRRERERENASSSISAALKPYPLREEIGLVVVEIDGTMFRRT